MRSARATLGTLALGLALAGLVGCSGVFPPPAPKDESWCNIQAVPCAIFKLEQCCVGVGACAFDVCIPSGTDPVCITNSDCTIPIGCSGVICGGILQDPATVSNPALCPTVTASAPGAGDRVCFKHTMELPQDACAADCSPFSGALNSADWPTAGNLRSRCSAALNTDPAFHGGLMGGFVPNGCVDPGPALPLASQGTHAITLSGAGMVTINAANPTPIAIVGGFFDIAAPSTGCSALQATCPTQLNQAEVIFSDFTLDGHTIRNLTVELDAQILTASGVQQGNHFIFTIPQSVTFDALATVDGHLTGLTVSSTEEVDGSINLDTGALAFQFDLTGSFDGKTLEATGVATSATVVAVAPVVTAGPITTVGSPGSCSDSVTLTASASSAAGLPVTVTYIVDDQLVGSGASVTTTSAIGTKHDVTIFATDSNGMRSTVTESLTPTDTLAPSITCPASQTLECVAQGAVATFAPTVTDNCGAATTVCTPPSGTTFSKAASPTTDTCTATDASGNAASCSFQVTVQDTLPPTLTLADDGTGHAGTLWPPDHRYVSHTIADCIAGQVVDQCDGPLDINQVGRIVRITSSEAENAPGDGNTCADMVITGRTSFQLRSERSGAGAGRVYTVEFTVSDTDQNTAIKSCTFQVPHDQRGAPADTGTPVYCVGTGCGGLPGNDPSCH